MTQRPGRLITLLGAVAVVMIASVIGAPMAGADPAGPTSDRSRVVSITPPTDSIQLAVIGGDSFLRIQVRLGHRVSIPGYRGEPYLRIDRSGTVWLNAESPSATYNENRFGELPSNVDSGGPPRWQRVGSNGEYAWHDHRTHWMTTDRPLGAKPGQVILDNEVPLRVDGTPVRARVVVTWLPNPPWWPTALTAAVAAFGAGWVLTRRAQRAAAVVAVAGAAGLIAGGGEFLSLPSSTAPDPLWLATPAVALVLALWSWRRNDTPTATATLVAATLLAWWGWRRASGWWLAVLPTRLPFWLDRHLSAAATAGALVVWVVGVLRLFRPVRRRQPSDTM